MKRIDLDSAAALIDFSGGKEDLEPLAKQQLEGAVALHNRLATRGVAYLADEVGMGKTYIALGVVTLMRRFNPALRVLYLLPKNNVRDKWRKDYRSFIEHNWRQSDLAVKGLDHRPAAPYAVCTDLQDLIRSVATSSARDQFICTSAFSIALGNSAADLRGSLDTFMRLLPQHRHRAETLRAQLHDEPVGTALAGLKRRVKTLWASALNDVLPRYDLVVVDEAHNLKKSRNSSDRNQLLATLLGVDDKQRCRVGRLLLLSATPFDRQIEHLRNQLALFGFGKRVELPEGKALAGPEMRAALAGLIVRRLNALDLDGKRHTRNMYRHEHRSGETAEVQMSLEQQLFAALLQKKVSDYLQENCAGRFELGMLASFESYLPGERNRVVEFDGQEERDSGAEGNPRDAQDRHVVESLVEDYARAFGREPPHPKMDWVAARLHDLAFGQGRKQLLFVRRVLSVTELKLRLEQAYDEWLHGLIEGDEAVRRWFGRYAEQRREAGRAAGLREAQATGEGEVDATSENFFAWFYRGKNQELEAAKEAKQDGLGVLPQDFRKALTQSSPLFEPCWHRLPGMPTVSELAIDWGVLGKADPKIRSNPQSRLRNAQYAYLRSVAQQKRGTPAGQAARRILTVAFADFKPVLALADRSGLASWLAQQTLWDVLRERPALASLAPEWGNDTFKELAEGTELDAQRLLRRQLIRMELIGAVCRLDHPFIDLYALRAGLRKVSDDDAPDDSALAPAFAALLEQQAGSGAAFCSFTILRDIAAHLDLLIKLNFPEAYHIPAGGLTKYFALQLSPLAPVAGASGQNSGNRSPLARKFRMPGYPRVLVSTDVFQEGEDLHTFCDSVVHYGISASPIALEQKVGRVDRIASLAHRAMQAAGPDHTRHHIQVNYPHIRQSLEFFQVRQSAANLNAFLRSLHRIEGGETASAEVDIGEQLRNAAGIEPQLLSELESPFPVQAEDLTGTSRMEVLRSTQERMKARRDHALEQVRRFLITLPGADEAAARMHETPDGWQWTSADTPPMELQLRSAQGLPELLLAASRRDSRTLPAEPGSAAARIACLQALQADARFRLQLLDLKGEDSVLRRNAEICAGEQDELAEEEVRHTFARVFDPFETPAVETAGKAHDRLVRLIGELQVEHRRISVRLAGEGELVYFFHLEGREQKVRWCVQDGCVLMSSRVLEPAATLALAAQGKTFVHSPLVGATLRRNAGFDLVDFHVDAEGALAVRACHPLGHLDRRELSFISRAVAAEADRLYALNRPRPCGPAQLVLSAL